ncbi:MAG TPA: N-acetyltransferase family protein [Chitinophagaceae bacterium]|nr:N-acetyltransferase family protein [Chitinophagaceae bacterium]HNU13432.1 N-acetyltransferase family protein [Chitinophagaceae bacterium]
MIKLRLAKPADSGDILAIYAPYIEKTSFTFETDVPSPEAFAERISSYLESWPWLVCEVDGVIVGYAYAARYRERVAYQWSVESSVYVHDDHQRKGIARILYSALFKILKRQGFRNVYAVINLPNEKSVAFHESLGFSYFATYEQVGYKLGQWKNVGWWRLIVNEFDHEPLAPVLFSLLDKEFLPALFEQQTTSL